MNLSVFKLLFIVMCLFVTVTKLRGQQTFPEKIIPRYGKIQFAGSMGMLSAGTGWNYGKDHWETDILMGFVPRNENKRSMVTFTLKQNYIPWKVRIKEQLSLEILTCGLYINMATGSKLWITLPDQYSHRYYTFSTRIRTHIFLGERITFQVDKQKWKMQSISFFYEVSASDIYLETAFNNRTIKPKDYLSLSFGIKVQIL